jgi:hypothetical protein
LTGDLTVANGVVKIVGGKLIKQYEESKLLHNRLAKGKGTKIGDRGVEIPSQLGGNYNHRFMTDGGDFPAGGSPVVKRAQVFFKNFSHAARMTGSSIDSINSMDVAYVKDYADFVLDESMSAAYKMLNIYSWGTGNGRLATISSGANSATQTVSNNDANRYLRDGMVVDSITTATGTITAAAATVLNAKASATTFTTVAAMTTTVTSDIIVASGSYNLAPMGIRGMIDDTTDGAVIFQGLSRNTYPQYRAFRVNAGSVGLDVSHLRRLLSAGIHISAGELNRDKLELWSHPAQTSAYSALGWNLRRFEGSSKSIDLGFKAYEYEGIGWVEDVDAPKDEIDAIDWSTMAKYVAKDFGWEEKSGSILKQVPSATSGIAYTDQFEAYFTGRYNYGCTKPNANGWVDALAVPTGF